VTATPGTWFNRTDAIIVNSGQEEECTELGITETDQTVGYIHEQGDADLVIAAVNACKQINPTNPIAAAEAVPALLYALRISLAVLRVCRVPSNELGMWEQAQRDAMAAIEKAGRG